MQSKKELKEYEFIYDECRRMMTSDACDIERFSFEVKDIRFLADFVFKTFNKLKDLKTYYGE